jgi:hypothetical protein
LSGEAAEALVYEMLKWAVFVLLFCFACCLYVSFPVASEHSSSLDNAGKLARRLAIERFQHGGQSKSDNAFVDILVGHLFPQHITLATTEADDSHRIVRRILSPRMLGDENCVVYGLGIAGSMNLEIAMSKEGCKVFALDCTADITKMTEEGKSYGVTFLPWCIGKEKPFGDTVYTKGHTKDRKYQFFTLDQIMEKLGHKQVSLLKFDIEGFEWDLFDSLLTGYSLPSQLLFELHVEGVTPLAVPAVVVKGKNRQAVNDLFSRLTKLGYVVYDKINNPGDKHACDFSLIR